ncbi:MAG: ModD protein [Deltaproteobacteria bacterium]|jgi:molybdenum transport protein|nr:ModD protein [Deltaproteobacteria bacterium]
MFLYPDSFVESLLLEDLPLSDLTSQAFNVDTQPGQIRALARETGVAAGVEVAVKLFLMVGVKAESQVKSGEVLAPGQALFTATGPAGLLHAAYKTAQNVLEYSGGIATRARLMVNRAQEVGQAEVLVTRKHFPGTKRLSLAAAVAGGAKIHRTGLSDSILVFDQHSLFLGGLAGLAKLLPAVKDKYPEKKIALEVANLPEAEMAARAGADVIQCEKFPEKDLKATVEAVKGLNPTIRIVAAGGVNGDNAAALAATGVDGLVTSWPFFGKPQDIKMAFTAL